MITQLLLLQLIRLLVVSNIIPSARDGPITYRCHKPKAYWNHTVKGSVLGLYPFYGPMRSIQLDLIKQAEDKPVKLSVFIIFQKEKRER